MASKYLQQKYDDRWPTSWWTQYHVLTRRNFTQSKAKIWSKINLIHSVVLAIIAGLLWFQLPRTEEAIADRKAVIFFIYVYWSFIPLSYSVSSFPEERTVIDKERSSGAYRLSAYYLAKMTSELPLTLLLPSGFVLIVFWMAGLNGFWAYIGFWATVMLTSLFAQAAGFVIGVAVMDTKLCISVSKIFILTSMLAGGFLTTNTPFWLDWIKYLSFIYYSYHIGVILEFTEAPPFRCSMNGTTAYPDCKRDPALILYGNETMYLKSESVLEQMGITWPLWLYVTVIFCSGVVLRYIAYLILRHLRKPQ